MSAVIATRDLRKVYRRWPWQRPFVAVAGLTLTVERGEVFGFLGANGAGKTTVIRMLLGLAPPSAGEARILGRPASRPHARRYVGYLPESPYFYEFLTGRELLRFFATLAEVPGRERKTRIAHALELVGLADFADRDLRAYSKGMLQRIGLAQALIGNPEIIFLDEPTAGLDPLGRRDIRDLILDLRAEGKTVFLSSHLLSEVELVCDRVGILRRGELVRQGTLDELLARKGKEIVCSSPPPQLDQIIGTRGVISHDGDRAKIALADPSSTNAVLHALLDAGATVDEVRDVRESLEELLVRVERER
jgi:ABC-2 type transport system ATP-binding protein